MVILGEVWVCACHSQYPWMHSHEPNSVCVCVCACWCINWLTDSNISDNSPWAKQMRFQTRPKKNHLVWACACMCVCVTTWKQINNALNSTPLKILCSVCTTGRVCTPERESVDVERLCWFDWFSRSHLKLWMSWSPVYLKSPTSIPSPPQTLQSTMQFISPYSHTPTATIYS